MLRLTDKSVDASRLFLAFFGILFSFTALAGAFLANSKVNADDTTKADTVNISVSAACTMISGDNTYSTTLNPGQESADLGPSNIKVVCNDPNGYSIYAIGYSGDTYTGTNHTKLIGTNSTISTGTSGDNSWWAMKLSAVTGTYTPSIMNGYSSYSVVPDTFTQVARLTGATDVGDSAEGSNLQAFYKIKASTSQIADDYAGKVKYVLVHPNAATPGTYSITYNANGGSGTMTGESGLYNYEPHTLKANTFTAPSVYRFAGWCTTNTSQNSCPDGKIYTDEEVLNSSAIAAGSTLNLYAIWIEIPKIYMQDLTAAQCQAQATDVPLTVYDRRDESDYTVRYINGNCWMTQNLRIVGTISATDSNFTGAAFNSSAGGDLRGSNQTYTAAQSHLADGTDVSSAPSGYTVDMLGAWYNFCAASAGQVCSNSVTQDATRDICPAGWHLPSHSQNSGIISYASSFSPVYGGYYVTGGSYSTTTIGYWWSSTAYNTYNQYFLKYLNSGLSTLSNAKVYGQYIRCIRST